jgi:hypothetical protein
LLLLVLAACGKPEAEKKDAAEKPETESGVSLKAEEIKSLGIATRPAEAASYRAAVSGYGVVVALVSSSSARTLAASSASSTAMRSSSSA